MFRKKKIILSFDYELFFGDKSGTVLKTLIEPTNKILDALDAGCLKGTFFVDYLMFKYLELNEDFKSKQDLSMLQTQIQDIVKRGHRIELHLHPHWVDAKYNGNGTWNYSDFSHYMLSTFNEADITAMFREGTEYLTKLARKVNPHYKIIAFRAGGWAVQPFSKLKKSFEECGIKIDSSSSLGAYNPKVDQYYDFRVMPNKDKYKFSTDVCLEDEKGSFLEVPITSYHRNLLCMISEKICLKIGLWKRRTDGTHQRLYDKNKCITKKSFVEKMSKKCRNMLTFSQTSPVSIMMSILCGHNSLLCVIDHPKDFSYLTIPTIKLISKICIAATYIDALED